MSVQESTFVTFSCDGPECKNTTTFVKTQEGQQKAMADNPWLNSLRFVQTADGHQKTYCSDECELKAIATGSHNKQQKKIVETANNRDVELAAQAAARAVEATKAIKQGGEVTLHGS